MTQRPATPTHTVDLGDVRLACTTAGSGDVPLFLLHGFLGGYDDFDRVFDDLAADRQVVAYDHRGFARSSKPGQYSFDLLTRDLERLVDTLGHARVDLLGHSMGGSVALRYVLRHPDRVRSLVLVDTGARSLGRGAGIAVRLTYPYLRLFGAASFADRILGPLLRRQQSDIQQQVRAHHGEQRDAAMRDRFVAIDRVAYRALGLELSGQENLLHRLDEIQVPTTVITGTGDVPSLQVGSRELADGIPGAVHRVIDHAEHSPQVENPDGFLAAMREHFDRVAATPGIAAS